MFELKFRRSHSWSAALAVSRIEKKLSQCRERRANIDKSGASEAEEASELDAFIRELEDLLRVELAKRDRGASQRSSPVVQAAPFVARAPIIPHPSQIEFASAVVHKGKKKHDIDGNFFLSTAGRHAGSTEPKRYRIPAGDSDPDILRTVKMIEVPGLIHAMVMAEKAQETIDVEQVAIPEGALGINLSDAYRDHIFSVEAYNVLIAPGKSDDYLEQLRDGITFRTDP